MKKAIAVLTILVLSFVLVIGSYAGLDAMYANENVLKWNGQVPDAGLAYAKTVHIDPGQKLYILGWAAVNGTNLEKIYWKLDGVAKDCSDKYIDRADLATVGAISDAAYGTHAGFGNNDDMMELIGVDDLAEGAYKAVIIAKFANNTEQDVMPEFDLIVGNPDVTIFENKAVAKDKDDPGKGTWLNEKGEYAAVEFTTTGVIGGISLNYWASNGSNGALGTFTAELFSFNESIEKSMQGTPVASKKIEWAGDNNPAFAINFDTPIATGTYVFKVTIDSDSATGEQDTTAYVVLKPAETAPDGTKFIYDTPTSTNPFNFYVQGSSTIANDVFFAASPNGNPGTADASMIIFIVAAAAIALVVLKKKVF